MEKDQDIKIWISELNIRFPAFAHDPLSLQDFLEHAPTGARETGDYWYAKGVVNEELFNQMARERRA
jgi:hypothetical protein